MHKLVRNIKKSNLGKSYILISDELSKTKEKLLFVKNTLKITRADYLEIEEPAKIKISYVREIQKFISLKPHSSPYKIAVIFGAERLTDEAANALLKTLEEPQERSIIILVVKNKKELLATIISRCQIIRTNQSKEITDLDLSKTQKEIEDIKKFSIYKKFDYAKNIINCQTDLKNLFNSYLACYRREYLHSANPKTKKIITVINKSLGLLAKTNANSRLILENLLLMM